MPDIDIDFADRSKILEIIDHIKAKRTGDLGPTYHNTGVYAHYIPHDPLTKIAGIDYKQAELRGYYKVDFLNVSIYKDIQSEEHLTKLMETEPIWELLLQDEFTDLLFHLKGHGTILKKTQPTSVEQLAAVLAMIRPSKRHLIGKSWIEIMMEVWTKPENDEYYFKKPHAIAYAMAVVVQMNLICESLSYDYG
jgi:DNA polymerase III alpha subunit